MNIIKYTIKPISAWALPLRSDTLHGLVACQVREWEGKKACDDLVASFLANDPAFTCSSAFPKGFLPSPVLAPISRPLFKQEFSQADKNSLYDKLQEYKAYKKKTVIPYSVWEKHKNSLSAITLFRSFVENKKEWEMPSQQNILEVHNTVNRETGSNLMGGYYTTLSNYAVNELDIYVKAKDHDFFEQYLKHIGELGFGSDANLGKGRFILIAKENVSYAFTTQGTAFLNLSLFSAQSLADLKGYYKCFTKKGKTWVGKSAKSPFKKPFIAIEEGAVLQKVPEHCILENINADSEIVQLCHPLLLPCTLGEK